MITVIDVWPIIKARMLLQDDALQPLIDTYIAEIEHRILHYCGIESLPRGLLFTWASMTIDAVRVDLANVEEVEDTVGESANVKVGDTSVSAGSAAGGVINTGKAIIEEVVLNYKHDLNRYRKMRW
ncbi:hypothetical protein SAMN04487969_11968 [Paenibacillus algorifonticola]|uniref:Phage gp6-like head-tail connector protein n=1 Tax=Paenibacillus algorifonticola TaxID=684063 RepID=A0A1I2H1A1_9BACL|nr:hypothetical protein [Paenibacillus algorifonticola]SFF23059.1 hypothetical protein SAMN04487969_11968 [Paenibacillus algorifonticola]